MSDESLAPETGPTENPDLADRSLAGVLVRALGELDAEGVDQVPLERGVVGLRGRDDCLVQRSAVDGQPLAVEGLDLVRHGHVGVQVGVAGAGVAVGEGGGDESFGVDLGHPVGTGTGECCAVLQPLEHIGDGGVVGGFDLFGHRQGSDRP